MPPDQSYLSPGAQNAVKPGMTPCDQAHALNDQGMSHDAVKSLAYQLPEHDSIKWATASADKVSNPAHTSDFAALQAAKDYVKSPSPETQKAASLAASKTDFQTPGAWAAQSAGFAGAGGGLVPHAVTGTVLLAAAQGGHQISPPGPPKAPGPLDLAMPGKPVAPDLPGKPTLAVPKLARPDLPTPKAPEIAVPGPDGLTLTKPQRAEMSKNTKPFLNLGCKIGKGQA